MTTRETMQQLSRKAIKERERILKEQVENLYAQNIENIEDLREALAPMLDSARQMVLYMGEEVKNSIRAQDQMAKTIEEARSVIVQQEKILQKTIDNRNSIDLKMMITSITIGVTMGATTFLGFMMFFGLL